MCSQSFTTRCTKLNRAKRPKLEPWVGVIDAILEEDQTKPAKQRHTAQRIFDRLRVVTRKFQGVEDGG